MHRTPTNQTESAQPSNPDLTAAAEAVGLDVPGLLAQLLPPGAEPLEDERLCLCGHLEADHRVGGRCSRCFRRCLGFELAPDEDVTQPGAVPTAGEILGEVG